MKASLVSAAYKAVDAMKIARAKVAETAKDLARPTVMHMVFSLAALPHQLRRSIPAPRRIPARLAGGFTEACSALLTTNAAVVYSRLGAANGAPVATLTRM